MNFNNKLGRISGLIWITSLFLFIISIVWAAKYQPLYFDFTSVAIPIDIFIGIISFILMIIGFATKPSTRKLSNKKDLKTFKQFHVNPWVVATIVLVLVIAFQFGWSKLSGKSVIDTSSQFIDCTINGVLTKATKEKCTEWNDFLKTITPTLIPNTKNNYINQTQSSPKIECTGPDGKHFQATQKECDDFNNAWKKPGDQMVNCVIEPSCGGGTMYITKNQCDTQGCCEVNGSWKIYPNIDACRNAQKANQPSNSTTRNWDLYNKCSTGAMTNYWRNRDTCRYSYIEQTNDTVAYQICIGNADSNYNNAKIECEKL